MRQAARLKHVAGYRFVIPESGLKYDVAINNLQPRLHHQLRDSSHTMRW
jgi:hypothetical protein